MGSLGFRVGPHLPLRLRLLTVIGCDASPETLRIGPVPHGPISSDCIIV